MALDDDARERRAQGEQVRRDDFRVKAGGQVGREAEELNPCRDIAGGDVLEFLGPQEEVQVDEGLLGRLHADLRFLQAAGLAELASGEDVAAVGQGAQPLGGGVLQPHLGDGLQKLAFRAAHFGGVHERQHLALLTGSPTCFSTQ